MRIKLLKGLYVILPGFYIVCINIPDFDIHVEAHFASIFHRMFDKPKNHFISLG